MILYELRFASDSTGAGKRIEFKALDASEALAIAHQEAAHRSAELWEGGVMLCTITRSPVGGDEFWQVS